MGKGGTGLRLAPNEASQAPGLRLGHHQYGVYIYRNSPFSGEPGLSAVVVGMRGRGFESSTRR